MGRLLEALERFIRVFFAFFSIFLRILNHVAFQKRIWGPKIASRLDFGRVWGGFLEGFASFLVGFASFSLLLLAFPCLSSLLLALARFCLFLCVFT